MVLLIMTKPALINDIQFFKMDLYMLHYLCIDGVPPIDVVVPVFFG